MKKIKLPLTFSLFLIFLLSLGVAAQTFTSELNGSREMPANSSSAVGVGSVTLDSAETNITVNLYFSNLSGAQTSAKIYNSNGSLLDLPSGNFSQNFAITPAQSAELKNNLWFFKISSSGFPNGEIRGPIKAVSPVDTVRFPFSNGILDPAFDGDGILTTDINNGNNVAQAVAVQPDGKIVVAGFARNAVNNDDFAVARYNPNGSLDSSFGGSGIVLTPLGAGEDEAYAVAIQPDGKIVAAGHSFTGTNIDAAVVRYNPNGSLDPTFSSDGIVTTPIGASNDFLRSVALTPDGKIVVAGIAYNETASDVVVLRFKADGALDETFDGNSGTGNGIVTTVLGSGYSYGYGVAVQPDGKILVAGYYFNGSNNNDTAVIRYNPNGVLDVTFDGDGIAGTVIGPGTDEAFAITLQTDGKIVIAGCVNSGSGNDFLIARFNSNGSPDAAFGINGATKTPIGNGVDIASAVAIQSDGRIVAAGFSNNGSDNDFAVVRRNSDGTLDMTFDGDGKLITPIGTGTDSANGVAIQADGKIVAAGRTLIGTFADFAVVRYDYGTNAQTNDGFVDLNSVTGIRFENAFFAGQTSAAPVNSLSLPALPANLHLLTSPQLIQTSAGFSGESLVRFKLPTRVDAANFNAAQILQLENGVWINRTTTTPPRDFETRTLYARVTSLSVFAIVSPLTQTAEYASISGRVISAGGRAAAGAVVTLTGPDGQGRYTVANQFGYYRFLNTSIRENYVVVVVSKHFHFSPQIFTLDDEIKELSFTSL